MKTNVKKLDMINKEVTLTLEEYKRLEKLASTEKQDWILVSDRLPEVTRSTRVLVTIKDYWNGNHYVKEAQYWKDTGFAIYPPDEELEQIINGIVAWMELPLPYKEETK